MALIRAMSGSSGGGGGIEINPELLKNTNGSFSVNVDVGDYIVINGVNTSATIPSITGGDVIFSQSGIGVRFDSATTYSYVVIVKATATSVTVGSSYSQIATKL